MSFNHVQVFVGFKGSIFTCAYWKFRRASPRFWGARKNTQTINPWMPTIPKIAARSLFLIRHKIVVKPHYCLHIWSIWILSVYSVTQEKVFGQALVNILTNNELWGVKWLENGLVWYCDDWRVEFRFICLVAVHGAVNWIVFWLLYFMNA